MAYGGHILWFDAPNYIVTNTLTYTDTATTFDVTGATTNTTIGEHLPAGLTNIHGAIVAVRTQPYIESLKAHLNANCYLITRYSTSYNTTPGNYNIMTYSWDNYVGAAHATNLGVVTTTQALIPVVYDGIIPYITWNLSGNWNDMSADSGIYKVTALIYLLGVTI
jgi:hypothetical protein